MIITDKQKQILKAISYDDEKLDNIARKTQDKPDNIFDELHQLTGLGLVDSVEGFYCLTEAGVTAAAIDGNDIPDEVIATVSSQPNIKIEKPGAAAVKYRKGAGIVDESAPQGSLAKYLEGIRRIQNKAASTQTTKQTVNGQYSDDIGDEESLLTKLPEPEIAASSSRIIFQVESVACPVLLGLVPLSFCLRHCKSLQSYTSDEIVCMPGKE